MGNSPISGNSFIPLNINNASLRGEGTPPVTYVVLGSQDQFQPRQAPKKPGFFKKLLKWTAILGGLAVGGMAFKSYLSGTLAEAATKALTQVGNYIPGFIKAPFSMLAGTELAKTVKGWGGSLFNILKRQTPEVSEATASADVAQTAAGWGGTIVNNLKGLLGGFFNKSV